MRRLSILVLALAATVSFAAQPPDAAYLKDFEKWKGELVDDLKQNWLPLAGLFWLKPGANTFGAADDNAIVLPSGPAHAGTFRMEGAEVLVELLPGVAARSEEHTSELQSHLNLVCRLLLEKKKNN